MSLEARESKFFLQGKSLRLLSGTMHYFRVVPDYWRDRMLKMKACGLNCLETYVPWNLHEEIKGQFNFEGILDVRKFIQTAQEVGLYVLFRPGPYICAEWDFGGLPSWLLRDPNMKVRSSYKPYLEAVDRFLKNLLPQVVDLQHSKGGPIIAVQLENEYGSYENDQEYKTFLRQKYEEYGLVELFFTSDNGVGIQRGEFGDALITANFQEKEHGFLMFEYLKNVKQPGKPLMVMEFWTGWFDHWGEKHAVWPVEEYEKVLRFVLEKGGSVNFYMFHGGTNFGFMAGANEGLGATNEGNKNPYQADVTSYDYDAPLSENGELTPKWHRTKEIFQEMLPEQVPKDLPEPPQPIPTTSYGKVTHNGCLSFSNMLAFIKPVKSDKPIAMELLDINEGSGQSYGFTLYRTKLNQGAKLSFPGKVRDRAVIYIDGRERAVVDYMEANKVVDLGSFADAQLDVLVENMGRVNYAEFKSPVLNSQRKGLHDIKLDNKPIEGQWEMYPLEFKEDFLKNVSASDKWGDTLSPAGEPCICRFKLDIPDEPQDTFINMKAMKKGLVFVNGFNLGRYWEIGPQETLYVPAPLMKKGTNEILVFELHSAADHIQFDARPILGEERIHTTEIAELILPGVNDK